MHHRDRRDQASRRSHRDRRQQHRIADQELPFRGRQNSFARLKRSCMSNALPFSGLGAAKPALRFYADASAATRSAATACSAAHSRCTSKNTPSHSVRNVLLSLTRARSPIAGQPARRSAHDIEIVVTIFPFSPMSVGAQR